MCSGVKLLQSSNLSGGLFHYYIQQKSLQNKSSLRQMIIILLIGLNVFLRLEVKWQTLLSLFARAGEEVDMCAEAGAPRPGPLSFLFSYQRPSHTYQFQISQEQRERERPLTGSRFFFSPPSFLFFSFSEVNRKSAPLTFHRGKQLFIKAQQRQRPTWQPLNQPNN